MIKPIKPTKPKKPKLETPKRSVVECFYLYYVTKMQDGISTSAYELIKDDMIPMETFDYDGKTFEEPDGDYGKVENIELSVLLKFLEDRDIDVSNVTIDNEVYYRKCNGQLLLKIAKSLSDTDYQFWVDRNAARVEQFERDKEQHPALLEAYKAQKKLWDIHQAELKLLALRSEE